MISFRLGNKYQFSVHRFLINFFNGLRTMDNLTVLSGCFK